jgi:hypothetical protein
LLSTHGRQQQVAPAPYHQNNNSSVGGRGTTTTATAIESPSSLFHNSNKISTGGMHNLQKGRNQFEYDSEQGNLLNKPHTNQQQPREIVTETIDFCLVRECL